MKTKLIQIGEMRSSSAARWLACPGSTVLTAGEPSKSDAYASEGTAAHALLEYCLRFDAYAWDAVGDEFNVEGVTVQVTEEMADAVGFAVNWLYQNDKPNDATFETKLNGMSLGLPELTGHVDYRRIDGRHLTIIDYKHGAGVTVEAVGNAQLLSYAALSMADAGEPIETATLGIIQPRGRGDQVKLWQTDFATIAEHIKKVSQIARVVDYLKQNPEESLDRLNGGDHCQFCPALVKCPTYNEPAVEAMLSAFSVEGYFLNLTDAEVSFWYDNASKFRKFVDAVSDLAKERYNAGGMPGYKLVESLANRTWNASADVVEAKLTSLGFDASQLRKPAAMLGPKPIEELSVDGMTKKEVKAVVAELVHRPVRGVSLVHDTDKRPSAEVDAASEFDDVTT